MGKTPFGDIESIRSDLASVLDEVIELGRLPVVTFSAGGIATPSDAALMMSHGMDGVFVGSGIFKLSLIHISEPTRLLSISYAVFCLKKKK